MESSAHPARPPEAKQLRPAGMLALAAWCGLLAGVLEVSTKVVCTTLGRSGRLYQMSKHFCWLIPVTNLALLLVMGLFLAGLARLFPGFGRWFSLRILAALVVLPSLLVAVPEVYDAAWLLLAWGIAVQLVPVLERHARGFRRAMAITFPILIGIVVTLAGFIFAGLVQATP